MTTFIEVMVLLILTAFCLNIVFAYPKRRSMSKAIFILFCKLIISATAALVLAFNARTVMININTIQNDTTDIIYSSMMDALNWIKLEKK